MYKTPSDLPDFDQQFIQTRTVLFFGEVTAALVQTVSEQLLLLAAQSGMDIKLVVNAQGGPVSAGEALFDLIGGIGARVKVIGAGAVSQAAALAFVAPPRAQRYCLPHARFSLYQSLEGGAGLAGHDAAQALATAEELARHRRRVQELLARRTGQPLDVITRDTERPQWLSAQEALTYGLVGQVVRGLGDV
jgi:ATP-dependent Clp protease, protease subunit